MERRSRSQSTVLRFVRLSVSGQAVLLFARRRWAGLKFEIRGEILRERYGEREYRGSSRPGSNVHA